MDALSRRLDEVERRLALFESAPEAGSFQVAVCVLCVFTNAICMYVCVCLPDCLSACMPTYLLTLPDNPTFRPT